MKHISIPSGLRKATVIVWRGALILLCLAALVCAGLHMALQTVLCGPSETARDQLVLTLLTSAKTSHLPGKFLDGETIAAITAVEQTLISDASDPALITPGSVTGSSETLEEPNFTAQITLGAEISGIAFAGTQNYAGFTSDGKLLLATTAQAAAQMALTQRCGHILILNGQANEGLYNATSGFAPSVAIGQRADGTLILVTTDGWSRQHIGATHQDLIDIMIHYGAVNACVITGEDDLWNRK